MRLRVRSLKRFIVVSQLVIIVYILSVDFPKIFDSPDGLNFTDAHLRSGRDAGNLSSLENSNTTLANNSFYYQPVDDHGGLDEDMYEYDFQFDKGDELLENITGANRSVDNTSHLGDPPDTMAEFIVGVEEEAFVAEVQEELQHGDGAGAVAMVADVDVPPEDGPEMAVEYVYEENQKPQLSTDEYEYDPGNEDAQESMGGGAEGQQPPLDLNQHSVDTNVQQVIQPVDTNQQLLGMPQQPLEANQQSPDANVEVAQPMDTNQQIPGMLQQPLEANQQSPDTNVEPVAQPMDTNQQLPGMLQQPLEANQHSVDTNVQQVVQPMDTNQQIPGMLQQPLEASQQTGINQQLPDTNQQPVNLISQLGANQDALDTNQQALDLNQQPILDQQPLSNNQLPLGSDVQNTDVNHQLIDANVQQVVLDFNQQPQEIDQEYVGEIQDSAQFGQESAPIEGFIQASDLSAPEEVQPQAPAPTPAPAHGLLSSLLSSWFHAVPKPAPVHDSLVQSESPVAVQDQQYDEFQQYEAILPPVNISSGGNISDSGPLASPAGPGVPSGGLVDISVPIGNQTEMPVQPPLEPSPPLTAMPPAADQQVPDVAQVLPGMPAPLVPVAEAPILNAAQPAIEIPAAGSQSLLQPTPAPAAPPTYQQPHYPDLANFQQPAAPVPVPAAVVPPAAAPAPIQLPPLPAPAPAPEQAHVQAPTPVPEPVPPVMPPVTPQPAQAPAIVPTPAPLPAQPPVQTPGQAPAPPLPAQSPILAPVQAPTLPLPAQPPIQTPGQAPAPPLPAQPPVQTPGQAPAPPPPAFAAPNLPQPAHIPAQPSSFQRPPLPPSQFQQAPIPSAPFQRPPVPAPVFQRPGVPPVQYHGGAVPPVQFHRAAMPPVQYQRAAVPPVQFHKPGAPPVPFQRPAVPVPPLQRPPPGVPPVAFHRPPPPQFKPGAPRPPPLAFKAPSPPKPQGGPAPPPPPPAKSPTPAPKEDTPAPSPPPMPESIPLHGTAAPKVGAAPAAATPAGGDSQAGIAMYFGSHHYAIDEPFPGLHAPAVDDISDEERNYMRVRYTPPPITDIAYPGHKMKVPADYGREVAELTNHLVTLSPDTLENFVFVTGASSNHFDESRDAVASAQTQFPGKPILYFDLGLQENEISELKKWESVEYRWFNFSHYPGQFLVNLRRAAWKPFIIAEALKQYGGVFYMDSSIRVMTHDLQPAIRLATYNGGFVQFHGAKYSIYGGTHEKLYTYFPTKKPMMKNLAMNAGGALLVYNTEKVYKQLLWWWSMCTLDKQCYIPTLEMNCDMHTYDKWKDYMHCHKFDTSIINILLSNLHGYDATKYLAQDGMINIEKMPTTHFRTKYKS